MTTAFLERLERTRAFAIIRSESVGEAVDRGIRLTAAGIDTLEVSFTLDGAEEAIHTLVDRLPEGVLVGAGTVMTREQADRAIGAGSRFLVAPQLDVGVAATAEAAGVPYLPGALTPGEIVACWSSGATAVKVFPAGSFGPAYIAQLREPLPHIPLIAVGGVALDAAEYYLDAGAIAVGMGSPLIDRIDDLPAMLAALRGRRG